MDTKSADVGDERSVEDESAPEPRSRKRIPPRNVAVSAAALVVAVAAVATSVVYAAHSFGAAAPASASADRDAAVSAARSVASTMTTIKGGDPDATLKAWQAVITGELADQYTKQEPQLKQRIQQSSGNVSSTVQSSALSEFDRAAGTAAALVFVDTTLVQPGVPAPSSPAAPSTQPTPTAQPTPSPAPSTAGQPAAAPKPQRLALTMSLIRTENGWKASNLKPVDPAKAGQ